MPTASSMAANTLSTVPLLKLRPFLSSPRATTSTWLVGMIAEPDWLTKLVQREVVLALADLLAHQRLEVEHGDLASSCRRPP